MGSLSLSLSLSHTHTHTHTHSFLQHAFLLPFSSLSLSFLLLPSNRSHPLTDGLGVENLKGSGLIAGETSRAYDEIFTVTLVTGRSVGIGAYLVRLGQRAIQNQGPIILTGAPALNKVLGKDVYTSNVQVLTLFLSLSLISLPHSPSHPLSLLHCKHWRLFPY